MRTLRVTPIVSFILIIFLSSSLVSALNSNQASVTTLFSSQTVQPGDTVSVRIFFNNNSTEQLDISHVGLHFDWMADGRFFGYDLSSSAVSVSSGGSYVFGPLSVEVPQNVSAGTHSYYVGVDGTQGASSSFSWDSSTSTIDVYTNSENATPTPSTNAGGETGQTESSQSLLFYSAIVAIVVIIVISIIVMVMRKKRKPANPVAGQPLKTIEEQS